MISVILDIEKEKEVINQITEEYEIAYVNEDNNILIADHIKALKKMSHINYLILDLNIVEPGRENELILAIQDLVFSSNRIKIIVLTVSPEYHKLLLQQVVSYGIYNILEYPSKLTPEELAEKIKLEITTKRTIKDVYKYHSSNIPPINQKQIIKTKTIEKIRTETVKNKMIAIYSLSKKSGATTIATSLSEAIAKETLGGVCYIENPKNNLNYMKRIFKMVEDKNLQKIIKGESVDLKKIKKNNKVHYLIKEKDLEHEIELNDLYNIINKTRNYETIIFDFNSDLEELIKSISIWDYIYLILEDDPINPEKSIENLQKILKQEQIYDITNIICNKYLGLNSKKEIQNYYQEKTNKNINIKYWIPEIPGLRKQQIEKQKFYFEEINKLTKDLLKDYKIKNNGKPLIRRLFKKKEV